MLPAECPLLSAEDCCPPFLGGQSLLKCLASIMSDDDDDIQDDDKNDANKKDMNDKTKKEEKSEDGIAENYDYVI